jgi:hypothetical protein
MKGYVYIIQEIGSNYYKIGITTDKPIKRLAQLQTGNPHKLKIVAYFLLDDPKSVETFLHSLLSPFHIHLEWFILTAHNITELITYIERKYVCLKDTTIGSH